MLSANAFGQELLVAPKPGSGDWLKDGWSVTGELGGGQQLVKIYIKEAAPLKADNGTLGVWIKGVPSNVNGFRTAINVPAKTSYYLQYASVSCRANRYSLEHFTTYNSKGRVLPFTETIRINNMEAGPDSFGSFLINRICTNKPKFY